MKTKTPTTSNNYRYTTKTLNTCGTLHKNNENNKEFKKGDQIIFDGKPYEKESDIASQFNHFYKNIALDICNNIDKPINSPNYYLRQSKAPNEPLELTEITQNDVKMAVKSLSNTSSTGPDNISNKVLKKILPIIIDDLTNCINKSLKDSKFPQSLKTSKIKPIAKPKKDKSNPDNWRPIAQLSPLSKIYEKTIMNQITEQLNRKEILDPNQFGFRKGHSTAHPLMIAKDYIERELNNKKYVCLIALDLKKAFDCIKTDGCLQNKIKYFCQNDQILNWFEDYFQDRYQFVNWGNSDSDKVKNHRISIIQGSKNGPSLFNLYLNDLPKITKLKSVLYADDCTFICSHKNPTELNKMINSELEIIKDYFNANGLEVSISKTTYMI